MAETLRASYAYAAVLTFGRASEPPLDLMDESSVAAAAAHVAAQPHDLRLVFDATGMLQDGAAGPERALRQIDPVHMARAFAVNAIGPALLMKHFLPLLPRDERAIFATLSARVGSIGDNRLGGWYSYRASKAALNQLVHTAAIELVRTRPQAICVALHPGTVDTALSRPFVRTGLDVRTPLAAAARLYDTLQRLTPAKSGLFLDCHGAPLPW
jgi:NAD(P)-dependent dehydrogenase (short-subunit alcohol dehydrogenase family)